MIDMDPGNHGVEILIVEDSPTQAEELRYTLNRHNFHVSVAGNGIEALAVIRESKPTMVISDIVMPEMDGYQLCREIKKDDGLKDLPVILLTSLSDPRDVVRGLECGADNFITKPYEEKYILSRIQYVLANKHLKAVEQTQLGVEVILAGEKYFIKSDRLQILNLLLSSYEAAIQKNGELIKARDELKEFNNQLEQKVQARTSALTEEIRERGKIEKALRKSVERYRSLTIATTQIVWTTNAKGEALEDMPMWRDFTGQGEQQVTGWGWFDALHPADRQLAEETWAHSVETHTHYDTRFRLRRNDGEYRFFSARAVPVLEEDGAIREWVGTCTDITDQVMAEERRKKLESQLHHAQKMEALGTLVGGIAHDFNNILQAMIGFGSIMKMQAGMAEPLSANLDQILTLADRASTLTRSLLTFGRKQELETHPMSLNEIVRHVEKMLSRLLREDIEMKTTLSNEDLMVMADECQIQQVLMNLATNARDAMPAGGRISIGTEPFEMDEDFKMAHGYGEPGRHALLVFSDNGVGMEENIRQRIFEPFFTTKEVGKGTGLGLSVCYGIIKSHKGYITCYSEPGSGTTFRIYLPRIEAVREEVKSIRSAPPPRGSETILIAEDDVTVRMMTKAILETFGYQVIEAADGKDAVDRFHEHKDEIRLALLDVIMPKKNGKEVYDEISAIRPGIKVLLTSGYPADVFHHRDIVENKLSFISKPVTPSDLLRRIREILDKV